MCTILNSCSMSPHLIRTGYANLVSNKSETGTNGIIDRTTWALSLYRWNVTSKYLSVHSVNWIKKNWPHQKTWVAKESKRETLNSTCLKNMWINPNPNPEASRSRKKLFRLICSSDWHSNKIWFVKSFLIDTLVFMFYRYVNEMGVLYGVTYRSKFSQVIFPIEKLI